MGRIDLHMHSGISLDGEYTPEELAAMCREHQIEVAALADHNSVRGVAAMEEASNALGISVIPAVELDCTCDGLNLHLLGYGIDITDERFRENEQEIDRQSRVASEYMMTALLDMGILFDRGEVMKLARKGIVIGEMIAEAALADERNRAHPQLAPYRPGGERSKNPFVNFYWDFCSQGKPAFYPIRYPSFEDAVNLIRRTGGVPVLAHPAVTVGRREEMLFYMAEAGVEGIEVYSSYHQKGDILYYKNLAEQLNLFQTMGSDFHGKTKPSVKLGGTGGDACEEELLEALRGRKLL